MDWITSPEIWTALFTLTALEIVLGVDNIIFISILAGKLPPDQRDRARTLGLALAMITRVLLLFSLSWVIGLKDTLFTIFDEDISGRDLILLGGGLFLLAKSTFELHQSASKARKGIPRPGQLHRSRLSWSRSCCSTSFSRSIWSSPKSVWRMMAK